MINKILDIIKNDPDIKKAYEDKESCFCMAIDPILQDKSISDDNLLNTLLLVMASQCKIYDRLLNNIAKYGDKSLINECNKDIRDVFNIDE